ncbi:VWA domain-containing protein [Rhodococcus zopfii]|uniref:VWA domain-containing protein n=1 Tax=Rhodococcus zopfii TaxID=43772 RepID=UPI001F0D9A26|nr:VWA domain-containing protein [Rhodococcus zopfii]
MPDARKRRPTRRAAAYLVVIAILLGLGAGVAGAVRSWQDRCEVVDRYALAVAPGIADAVTDVLARADTGCTSFTVSVAEPGDVTGLLGTGEGAPDLWIPDSGSWATRASAIASGPVQTILTPIATTPAVLVARVGEVPEVATWRAALALPNLRPGNPLRTGIAASAIRAALAETEDDAVAIGTVRTAMAPLAQRESDRVDEPPAGSVLFDLIASDGGVGVGTEQQLQEYIASHAPETAAPETAAPGTVALEAVVPDNGSILLDYSLVVTSPEPERHRAATAAARVLADVFATQWARDVFVEHGFRDPAGHALPDGAGLGEITTMTLTDESIAQESLRAWAVLALPIRTLVAVDVSASMNTSVGGSTLLQLTEQAARSGTAMFPGSVQAGLWVFADDLGENGQDHREVLPIRRLDATVGGHTQRELMNSLSTAVGSTAGDRSAVSDTTLAAFRQMQATYDPRAINSVIVLTDGEDDEPDGISEEDLIATLEREQNPARPVIVVTVGITADADAEALAAISHATGGTSYIAQEPGDISAIFVSALADRAG